MNPNPWVMAQQHILLNSGGYPQPLPPQQWEGGDAPAFYCCEPHMRRTPQLPSSSSTPDCALSEHDAHVAPQGLSVRVCWGAKLWNHPKGCTVHPLPTVVSLPALHWNPWT